VAAGLKTLKVAVDLVLTSPYVRAVQTAEQVVAAYGRGVPLRELPELRPEETPRLMSLALKPHSRAQHVVCVGHNPHISAWLAELITTTGDLQLAFKKAAVACVDVPEVPPARGSGVLRWFMTSKQLARLPHLA
jgi:phosphohistidine phosphatase